MTMNNLYADAINEVQAIEDKYKNKIEVNSDLNRRIVSFQSSKREPFYRLYKFKEAYSPSLVSYIINYLRIHSGEIVDPFAGSGTTLFKSQELNLNSLGIELLPIGIEVIKARSALIKSDKKRLSKLISGWVKDKPWTKYKIAKKYLHVPITQGAFSPKTEELLGKFLAWAEKNTHNDLKVILKFAALSVLEEISFTRKDGQYLRWDFRATKPRPKNAKPFYKNIIKDFNSAIINKLNEIYEDLTPKTLFSDELPAKHSKATIKVLEGSCLELLPTLENGRFTCLITSPPYLNRYDYTRTYALELVMLGLGNEKIKKLRQRMISCTVENKEKEDLFKKHNNNLYQNVVKTFDQQKTLKAILNYLTDLKNQGKLNNPGILRMIKNYFYEMCLIINESARIIKPGGHFVMVNDNVRYAGIDIPVDLILSDFGVGCDFKIEKIWVLPTKKGNSSQQMGKHGRSELRKCVYVWKKL